MKGWLGAALVVGMSACLGDVLARLVETVIPGWNMGYLPSLFIFIALEAVISSRWRVRPRALLTSAGAYYLAEVVLLLVVIKAWMYVWLSIQGQPALAAFMADVEYISRGIFDTLFTPQFVLTAMLALLAWFIATQYANDLHELEGSDPMLERSDALVISNRAEVRKGISRRVLAAGIVLVVAAGVSDQNLFGLRGVSAQRLAASEQVTLVYFVLGLLLMSLVHYAALRSAWAYERIPIDPQIIRRWAVTSLLILVVVGAVAFALPTNYALGLLETAYYLVNWVFTALLIVAFLISIPFMALIAAAAALLNLKYVPSPLRPLPTLPPVPTPLPGEGPVEPTLSAMAQSLLFWGILGSVVVYALVVYFRQNSGLLKGATRKRGWRIIVGALGWLRSRLLGVQAAAGQVVSGGLDLIGRLVRRAPLPERWKYTRISSLPPREQVRFYYLALLRRSAESGTPRQPNETPFEYARSLEKTLQQAVQREAQQAAAQQTAPAQTQTGEPAPPTAGQAQAAELSQAVETLTSAFVEARYSPAEISPDEAQQAYTFWERLRRALAPKRKS